jgi:hypothetical protein
VGRRRGRPPKNPAPPPLAEDPAQLAAEAAGATELPATPAGKRGGARRRPGGAGAAAPTTDAGAPGAVAPPPVGGEVTFPVEAIAAVHGELWNALAKRLRSRWALSEAGAFEMGRSAEIVMRQYLGPYLAEHAALCAYLMTQAAALLALLAMREEPQEKPKPLPDSGVARAAAQPAA